MKGTGSLWGIVLAGGSGQRLQSFLRRRGHEHPVKQFCAIAGGQTMLQQTWQRAEILIPRERVLTVVGAAHAEIFRDQLADRVEGTVIVQPANRETGPGTMLPLAHVLHADPEARVVVLPSDHFVEEEDRFMLHVEIGEWLIRRGLRADAALLGIEAECPNRDYGWIELRRAGRHRASCVLPVERFWEKPELFVARRLYEEAHLWSTMVTVARAASLWGLFRTAVPDVHAAFQRIKGALGTPSEAATVRDAYETMPSVSLSKGVFERLPSRIAAIPVRGVHWSDWGREERVVETLVRLGGYVGPVGGYPSAERAEAQVRWATE
jgi:mannose-1-phosphate guanylyltransferase